ncbi:Protein of unknown function [Pyronema omphalodes CBS 100304]|uniref:Uncharacterized protein n=1 Tax=Pyronema omphalodes (strain CBS 100304) TaxID=1076935 RepID=U4LD74_PYROM|nr:Protein of unknown function [Pyronema omphalodes CBS 100304]
MVTHSTCSAVVEECLQQWDTKQNRKGVSYIALFLDPTGATLTFTRLY